MDITVEELKERLDKGEDLNFYDVREEHEYEEDNLGAILIPLGEFPDHLDELEAQSIYIFREAFARLKKLNIKKGESL